MDLFSLNPLLEFHLEVLCASVWRFQEVIELNLANSPFSFTEALKTIFYRVATKVAPPPLNIYVSLSSNNKFTKLSFDLTCKENNHPMCGWSLYEVIEPGAHLEGRSNMPNQFIFQNDIEAQYETPTNRSTDFDPSKKSYRIQNQYYKFSHCFFSYLQT